MTNTDHTMTSVPTARPAHRTRRRIAGVAAALALAAPVTAVAASPADAQPAATVSPQDAMFLRTAVRANLAEIATGKLAAHRADRRAVRSFGREMVRDHQKQLRALRQLAARLDVRVPSRPSAGQRHVAKLLRTTSGRDFTCMYVPFQWDDHQLVIARTTEEVRLGSDTSVVAAARASLPVLDEHYRMVSRLLKRLHHC